MVNTKWGWVSIHISQVASGGYEYRKAHFSVLDGYEGDFLGRIEWSCKLNKYVFEKYKYEKVRISRAQRNYIKDFLIKLGDRDDFDYTVYGLEPIPISRRHRDKKEATK